MIGKNPYKIHFEVVEHIDALNASHRVWARCSFLDQAVLEREIAVLSNPGVEPERFVIYKTEANAYGVVLGRERVSD